jgi:hypothetical protein
MNDQNPETIVPTDSKPNWRDRIAGRVATSDQASKPKSNFGQKAKTALAVVGGVTLVGAAAGFVTRKKSAKVEVTLPDVDVTTEDAPKS